MRSIYFETWGAPREHYPFYAVTWRSLVPHLKGEEVVVVNAGASDELMALVPKEFRIVKLHPNMPDLWCGVSIEHRRWLVSRADDNDLILFADDRDTVFQRNPFDDLQEGCLMFSGEGPLMQDDPWNTGDQEKVQNDVPPGLRQRLEVVKRWPAICAGILAGARHRARGVAIEAYLLAAMMKSGATDQGAMNYIANNIHIPDGATVATPATNDWCLSGHHYRLSNVGFADGKVICNHTGRPYALVHQWDRTQWRDDILRQFGFDPIP